MATALGPWIEARRKALGFPAQKHLAVESGLSLSVIHAIERTGSLDGRSEGTVLWLARTLRVSVSDLKALEAGEISTLPEDYEVLWEHGLGSRPSPARIPAELASAIRETVGDSPDWMDRFGPWLAAQSPDFREFIVAAVARFSASPGGRIAGVVPADRSLRDADDRLD